MVNRHDIGRLTTLVHALDLPSRFDLPDLITAVEAHRGRRIACMPAADLDTGAEVCGLVISSPQMPEDVIFYAPSLLPWHLEHTIAHELGHLVAGHTATSAELPPALSAQLRPLLQTRYHIPLLGKMLGRHRFDTEEEREAELFAGLVLESRERDAVDGELGQIFQPTRRRRNTK